MSRRPNRRIPAWRTAKADPRANTRRAPASAPIPDPSPPPGEHGFPDELWQLAEDAVRKEELMLLAWSHDPDWTIRHGRYSLADFKQACQAVRIARKLTQNQDLIEAPRLGKSWKPTPHYWHRMRNSSVIYLPSPQAPRKA